VISVGLKGTVAEFIGMVMKWAALECPLMLHSR
jgi:hypothetical protein